ncbi:MAG: cupredoxin family protein [Burkholderiaceae bacterium]
MKRVLALVLSTAAGALHAHGGGHDSSPSSTPRDQPRVATAFGRTGDPARATRTVKVEMRDTMRFSPAEISVRAGETVRFAVANRGQVLHEMVIGTEQDLATHAEWMMKFPGMEHDEPFMAHVSPGQSGEIVWQFTTPGEFRFACLVPGHYEAGMVGRIHVLPAQPAAR